VKPGVTHRFVLARRASKEKRVNTEDAERTQRTQRTQEHREHREEWRKSPVLRTGHYDLNFEMLR
jgi:hypothetical protein